MKNFYILNGRKAKEDDITFKHLKRGFLYGDGVFETLRATNYKIFMWDQHIKRLKQGALVCELEISEEIDLVRRDIEKLLTKNRIKDAYIRINLWREIPESFDPEGERRSHLLVIVRNYHPYPEMTYREGIRCIISKKCFRNEKSPLVYIKSLNYLENILARMDARKNNCDDAILINTSGYLASATVANLFFVKKGSIFTPSLDCGVLKGTIRDLAFDTSRRYGIEIEEGRFTVDDLKDADEIFLTNTLMGVMPVREIKGVFKGKNFTLSMSLKEELARKIKD